MLCIESSDCDFDTVWWIFLLVRSDVVENGVIDDDDDVWKAVDALIASRAMMNNVKKVFMAAAVLTFILLACDSNARRILN